MAGISYDDAMDNIRTQFNTAWSAGAAAIAGYVPEVRWQDDKKSWKPPSDKIWCRHAIDSVTAEQTNVSVCDPQLGTRRFTDYGLVFVQIFVPEGLPNAQSILDRLAMLARDAYRGKVAPGNIVFRTVRINRIPPEDVWFRRNVVSEYEFDDFA